MSNKKINVLDAYVLDDTLDTDLFYIGKVADGKLYKIAKSDLLPLLASDLQSVCDVGNSVLGDDNDGEDLTAVTVSVNPFEGSGFTVHSEGVYNFDASLGTTALNIIDNDSGFYSNVSAGYFDAEDGVSRQCYFGYDNVVIKGILGDYADDAAAALGSVVVGGVYHTSGVLKIRLS